MEPPQETLSGGFFVCFFGNYCNCVCVCLTAYMQRSENNLLSPSTTCVLGIGIGLPNLAITAFTTEPSHQPKPEGHNVSFKPQCLPAESIVSIAGTGTLFPINSVNSAPGWRKLGDPVTWNKALEKKVLEVGHWGVEGKRWVGYPLLHHLGADRDVVVVIWGTPAMD